jgi:dephospho-CoA kinase
MMTLPPGTMESDYPWPVIGIVGGIGSGKSLVAGMFGQLGCKVICSDEAAHRALQDAAIKSRIIAEFGTDILGDQHEIDRSRLGKLVFSDAAKRASLNAIVHPYVAEYRLKCLQEYRRDSQIKGVVLDSPLLAETGLYQRCHAVVYVHCEANERYSRVQKNRGWSLAEWQKREAAQWSLDKKLEISHYVVSNEAEAPHTAAQVNWVLACITRDFQRSHGLRGTVS